MKLRSFLVLYQLVVECFGYLEWMHTRANLFHVTFLLPYFVFFLPWMIHGQQLGPLNPFFQSYFQDKALIHQYPIIALFLSSPQSSYWLIQVYQMPGLGSRISRDGFSGYSLYNLRCIFVMIFFFLISTNFKKTLFSVLILLFFRQKNFYFSLAQETFILGALSIEWCHFDHLSDKIFAPDCTLISVLCYIITSLMSSWQENVFII